jgi:hypothetical protein
LLIATNSPTATSLPYQCPFVPLWIFKFVFFKKNACFKKYKTILLLPIEAGKDIPPVKLAEYWLPPFELTEYLFFCQLVLKIDNFLYEFR